MQCYTVLAKHTDSNITKHLTKVLYNVILLVIAHLKTYLNIYMYIFNYMLSYIIISAKNKLNCFVRTDVFVGSSFGVYFDFLFCFFLPSPFYVNI